MKIFNIFSRNVKKAELTIEVPSAIVRIFFITACVLSVTILVRMYIVDKIDIRDAESRIIANRIVFSPNAISYYDEKLERLYPGIIDAEKLKDNVLDSALTVEKGRISAKVTLYNDKGNKIKEAFAKKDQYETWYPLAQYAKYGVTGPGGAQEFIEKRAVLYIPSKENTPSIEFVNPILAGAAYDNPISKNILYDKEAKNLVFALKVTDPDEKLKEINAHIITDKDYHFKLDKLEALPNAGSQSHIVQNIVIEPKKEQIKLVNVNLDTLALPENKKISVIISSKDNHGVDNEGILGSCSFGSSANKEIPKRLFLYPAKEQEIEVSTTILLSKSDIELYEKAYGIKTEDAKPGPNGMIYVETVWKGIVKPDGTIASSNYIKNKGLNNWQGYTYKSIRKKPRTGFSVKNEDIYRVLERELKNRGFNDKEISDIEKWFLDVTPIDKYFFLGFGNELNRQVIVKIEPTPDKFVQVDYYLQHSSSQFSVSEPLTPESADRNGKFDSGFFAIYLDGTIQGFKHHGIEDSLENYAYETCRLDNARAGTLEISVISPNR